MARRAIAGFVAGFAASIALERAAVGHMCRREEAPVTAATGGRRTVAALLAARAALPTYRYSWEMDTDHVTACLVVRPWLGPHCIESTDRVFVCDIPALTERSAQPRAAPRPDSVARLLAHAD